MILLEGYIISKDASSFLDNLTAIATEHECVIQSFDARYIAGKSHLTLATKYSKRAFEREDSIAKDPAVELLLYASGRRQINRAMEMCINPETTGIVIVIYGEKETISSNSLRELILSSDVIKPIQNIELLCTFFDITPAELEVSSADIESLVLERVALLNLSK
jgi:KEOPS complex subunit Cgi121